MADAPQIHAATPRASLACARREYQLLAHPSLSGIPAPRPCGLDEAHAALVVEYIAGDPEFTPPDLPEMLSRMVCAFCRIHTVSRQGLDFLEHYGERSARRLRCTPSRLDETLGEANVRLVLQQHRPWPQYNSDCLLHGDYWPGNLA